MWLLEVTVQGHEVLWDVECNRRFVTENEDDLDQGKCSARKRELNYIEGKIRIVHVR